MTFGWLVSAMVIRGDLEADEVKVSGEARVGPKMGMSDRISFPSKCTLHFPLSVGHTTSSERYISRRRLIYFVVSHQSLQDCYMNQ